MNLKFQKDLGVYITEDLSWDLHISESIKRANSAFLVIKRNSPKLCMSTKLNLYKSMILSNITYSIRAGASTQASKVLVYWSPLKKEFVIGSLVITIIKTP